MKRSLALCLVGIYGVLLLMGGHVMAHCEIPCGIYDDEMRVKLVLEHITTIEKSMKQIIALEKEEPLNTNQLVRWVTNKEDHADQLQEIVSQYFLTQRIKPGVKGYQAMLASLHEMMVYSMKCKQTTDLEHVKKLRHLVGAFEALYFNKKA